ncbi:hypothetical protein IH879_22665 [candidate division KSB1 bacterium]|nr:hypothetical protein [candidate division KSB1 bacterium]
MGNQVRQAVLHLPAFFPHGGGAAQGDKKVTEALYGGWREFADLDQPVFPTIHVIEELIDVPDPPDRFRHGCFELLRGYGKKTGDVVDGHSQCFLDAFAIAGNGIQIPQKNGYDIRL